MDVVDLAEAPLRLAGRILKQRRVVTGFEATERVEYETDLFPRYIDFEYHARKMDEEILAAFARGERCQEFRTGTVAMGTPAVNLDPALQVTADLKDDELIRKPRAGA